MINGFKLLKLVIVHKKRKIFDIEFLNNYSDHPTDEIFSSVVIGSNGSGKSYLLTLVTETFRIIENRQHELLKETVQKYDTYEISYIIGGNLFNIILDRSSETAFMNEKKIELYKIELPSAILGVSFMVNDKFVFQSEEDGQNSIYKYLGIRAASNATWTNTIRKKMIDVILDNMDNKKSLKILRDTLEFLDYTKKITLKYEISNKSIFNDPVYDNKFNNYLKSMDDEYENLNIRYENMNYFVNRIESRISKIGRQNSFRRETLSKLDKKDIKDIGFFIFDKQTKNKITTLTYEIDLNNPDSGIEIKQNKEILESLMALNIIKSPELLLAKNSDESSNDYFEFENASSGEKHFLFSTFNIVSKIKNNALVLVDEPELSFHPNWQMKYVNYIKKVFKSFKGSHFILATHSHYILSDLKPESSSIISLSFDSKKKTRTAELIKYDTYAWSAENILYNVFKVRTTRNYYFEEDIKTVLRLISTKSEDVGELERLISKLRNYVFDDADPMKVILYQANEYLKERMESE